MKVVKYLFIVIIILALCPPPPASAGARQANAGGGVNAKPFIIVGKLVNEAYANLHSRPSLDSAPAGRLLPSDTCRVISKQGAFFEIELNGARSFVYYTMLAIRLEYISEGAPGDNAFSAEANIRLSANILNRHQKLELTGHIRASAPVKRVTAYVFDEDKFKIEANCEYAPNTSGATIDISELGGMLNISALSCGLKRIYVIASDGLTELAVFDAEFVVLGEASEPIHITNLCGVNATDGYASNLTDARLNSRWAPANADSRVTITLPKEREAALMTLTWFAPPSSYTVTIKDDSGSTLDVITIFGGLRVDALALPEHARDIIINTGDLSSALSTLRVYDAGYIGPSVQRWTPLPEKVDIMLISAHQDDEMLFFGGAIPASVQRDKAVAVVYMADCGIGRYQEALNGLWAAGLREHPIFLGYEDYLAATMREAQSLWAKHAPLNDLASLIRRYRPDVIVTHDYQGEYGHKQHIYTAQLAEEAVKLAADAAFDAESYARSGAWQVKKLYSHLYAQNEIIIDWNAPIDALSAFTPMQLAIIGYDKHLSQHSLFKMETAGVVYDNRRFGLVYSAVGEDILKNDFFENI